MAKTSRYARLKDPHGVEFAPVGMTQAELTAGGYFPFEEKEKPEPTENVIPHNYKPVYVKKSNKIIRDWEAYPNFAEIERLKKTLAESDYKMRKCYEYSLVGKPSPYDVAAIHEEAQEIRNEINRLEACE